MTPLTREQAMYVAAMITKMANGHYARGLSSHLAHEDWHMLSSALVESHGLMAIAGPFSVHPTDEPTSHA